MQDPMDRISVMNISVQSAIAREIFLQIMIFLQYLHQIVNIKVNGQISFQLSTWVLNYAIESLFKFYTLCKNHSFFYLHSYLEPTKYHSKIQTAMFLYPCGYFPLKTSLKEFIFSFGVHLFKRKSTKKT